MGLSSQIDTRTVYALYRDGHLFSEVYVIHLPGGGYAVEASHVCS